MNKEEILQQIIDFVSQITGLDVVDINPNEDLEITLQSDLALRLLQLVKKANAKLGCDLNPEEIVDLAKEGEIIDLNDLAILIEEDLAY